MLVLTALPLAFWGCTLLALGQARQLTGRSRDWRSTVMGASVIWGCYLTLTTQLLSLIGAFNRAGLALAWTAGVIGALTTVVILWRKAGRTFGPREPWPRLPTWALALLGGIIVICGTTALIAIVSPPNNWDSMTYHMVMVVHWIQNRTVAFYPTHFKPQIQQPPWAEYAITHFVVLSGSDALSNLVQWFSMVGSLIGVSLIARDLKADWRGQLFAAVFAVSLPMGILQSASTQNDYVMTFWLVSFVYYLGSPVRSEKLGLGTLLAIGASLGLAVLTKPVAYIYAFPFAAAFGWVQLRKVGRQAWLGAFTIAAAVLLLNGAQYWRNVKMFGSPLGPASEGTAQYTNELYSPSALASNILRNLAIHAGTPNQRLNQFIVRAVTKVHKVLFFIDPSDPRTTWAGNVFQLHTEINNEDVAGNPLHLAMIGLALVLGPVILKRHPSRNRLAVYAGLLLAAFVLFCLVLKWQPWNSRLQLPLFVLWAPVLGVLMATLPYPRIAALLAGVLLIACLPWLLNNWSRPLIGAHSILFDTRANQYFRNNPGLQTPYTEAAAVVRAQPCADIGLIMGTNEWEYPLWVLLDNLDASHYRLQAINVTNNASGSLSSLPPFSTFQPCEVIVIHAARPDTQFVDSRFDQLWTSATLSVYLKR